MEAFYLKIAELLAKAFGEKATDLILYVLRDSPLVLKCILIFGIGGFAYGLWSLSQMYSEAEKTWMDSLQTEMEDTRQKYKGLESFVLSGTDRLTFANLKNHRVDAKLGNVLKAIEKDFRPNLKDVVVEIDQIRGGSYLTEPLPSKTFLFVPDIAFRPLGTVTVGAAVPLTNLLEKEDGDVVSEIIASKRIEDSLCDLIGEHLDAADSESRIVQSYYISASGVFRFCTENHEYQTLRGHWPHYRRFQDAPYFKPTIDMTFIPADQVSNANVDPAFHLTRPYVDTSGAGLVLTACRQLFLEGREGILCVDMKLNPAIIEMIAEKVKRVGGVTTTAICDAASCSLDPTQNNDEIDRLMVLPQQKTLEKWIPEGLGNRVAELSKNAKMDMAGAIQIHPSSDSPSSFNLTLPIGKTATRNRYLVANIDLARARWARVWRVSLVSLSLSVVIFGIMMMLRDYRVRLEAQKKAFETVDGVMGKAPLPYVRLDEYDHFISGNDEFVRLLGEKVEDRLKVVSPLRMFRDHVATESLSKYDDIAERRKNGEHIEPYVLRLKRSGSVPNDVTVYSGAVPDVGRNRKKRQTFGIFLAVTPQDAKVSETPRAV